MSWTRHLYDPVGAIARDTGLIGGRRRVMTPDEIAQARGGGGQSARDPSRVGGAYSQSRRQPSEASYERPERAEPIMADSPMPKPAPAPAASQKPVADPWRKPGAGLGGGAQGPGVRMEATASPAAALSGGAMSPASHVNPGASTAAAQVNNAGPRPDRGPVGPLPGQPGNPYTTRIANGEIPQDPNAIAAANSAMERFRANRPPIMSDYAPPPAPTGRMTRRPFP